MLFVVASMTTKALNFLKKVFFFSTLYDVQFNSCKKGMGTSKSILKYCLKDFDLDFDKVW